MGQHIHITHKQPMATAEGSEIQVSRGEQQMGFPDADDISEALDLVPDDHIIVSIDIE